MAASTVTIDLKPKWQDAEPDGSPCWCCGDHCLLRMSQLGIILGGQTEVLPTDIVLCGSCSDRVADW